MFRPVDRHGNVSPTRLTADSVARILKRLARHAGLDPATVAGHSLRRGHATQAARNDAPLTRVQRQLGHARVDTTSGYFEHARAVEESTSSYLDL